MTRPVRIEPEAAAELEEAALWYENHRQGLGREFLERVDRSLSRLDRWPHAGVAIPGLPVELEVRRVPVSRYPYHIVYLLATDAIRILAVAHDRRMPGYWRSRLDRR